MNREREREREGGGFLTVRGHGNRTKTMKTSDRFSNEHRCLIEQINRAEVHVAKRLSWNKGPLPSNSTNTGRAKG